MKRIAYRIIPMIFSGGLILMSVILAAVHIHVRPAIAATGMVHVQDSEEAYLSFRYRGVGDVVIIARYSDGNVYLPVGELFDLLGIHYQVDILNMRIHGHFLEPDRRYEISFRERFITIDGRRIPFHIDDMLVEELDFYLRPDQFQQAFGLDFTIDMSNLLLRLHTTETMPVVERLERRQRRERMERGIRTHQLHPLEFERDRQLFAGGFMDYSLTGTLSDQMNHYSYTAAIGTEVLGGDLRGSLFGSWSQTTTNFQTSGLRWRYVFEDQDWLTQFRAGQYSTQGPNHRQFRGVHFTNQPVEPRRMLDDFVLQGTAPLQSEVELFMNNRLIDYKEVDDAGDYRFVVPLTYGSNQVRIMVYEPDGRMRELDRRIQVPFTFLPPGELNYHVSAGRMETPVFGTQDYPDLLSADFSYGLTNRLTARAGSEYLSGIHHKIPFYYGGISARIFDEYLVNIDAAPEAYYRMTTSVVYPNSVSWDVTYTYFTIQDGLYNMIRSDQEFRANLFFPVNLRSVPLTFRIGADRQEFGIAGTNRIRGDLGVRIGRFSFRSGYRDTWRFSGSELLSNDARVRNIATYSFGRSQSVSRIFRGTYLRTQLDYSLRLDQIERVDVQIARSLSRTGRLRLAYGRNMIAGFNIIEAGLTFDFNRTRSTTTARSARDTGTLRQNIRGSVGYDDYHRRVIFENRQQVGRSAASVRLFVDRNNSGTYDEGDELIRANAVRIGRSGNTRLHSDGVIRVTQLQQYYRDNMEINPGAIYNPLLVPVVREFSFVADPNRFKPMDIPFYVSGVIDGTVYRYRNGVETGLGGVRIHLRQVDGEFRETLRTFSDGTFYAMEIPPGRYEAWVDSSQQHYLNAQSYPEIMNFEIRALAEGDFLEDLRFVLLPPYSGQIQMSVDDEDEEAEVHLLAVRANRAIRTYIAAQEAFYARNFNEALELVETSLGYFETDYGLVFKGTMLFILGRRSEAGTCWDRALARNPDIKIPDTDLLELLILNDDLDLLELSDFRQ